MPIKKPYLTRNNLFYPIEMLAKKKANVNWVQIKRKSDRTE